MNIKSTVEDRDTKGGRIFDYSIQTAIVLSILTHSISTLPSMKTYNGLLTAIEIVLLTIFSMEYILRVFVADKPFKFMTSAFGLIDAIAILPALLTFGAADFRFLRIFRLLRILKLTRFSESTKRFGRSVLGIKEELLVFSLLTCSLMYVAAAGIYHFENPAQPEVFSSIFHSLWWAVATLSTVGYGDLYPVTVGGRLFTFFILMMGLGIVAVPSGLLAASFAKEQDNGTRG